MTSEGYIGVTYKFKRRMWEHERLEGNRHIKFAIAKYGWDNLVKTQILISDKDYCLDIEKKLRPHDDIGWNCTSGGGIPPSAVGNKYALGKPAWNKGLKMSDETRAKVSKAAKEQWQRLGMREILSAAKKGKPGPRKGAKLTPETIEKMRASKIGIPSKKKGTKAPPQALEKYKATIALQPWTCVHCKKEGFGFGLFNRWHNDNCKKKGLI
jgi:hypothetical protein